MQAYPLTWPHGVPRAKHREVGAFKTSLAGALKNVQDALRRFGADSRIPVKDIILSSNVTLGIDKPEDSGVAVWFTWDGNQVCIPVDRYRTPAANLQAIFHIIEARRVELRHGTLTLVRATFQGFRALPPPAEHREWWDVLEVKRDASETAIKAAYRTLSSRHHPDRPGGSHERMAELNAAYQQALEMVKS